MSAATLFSGTAGAAALTVCALNRIEAGGCDPSVLLAGPFASATGGLILDGGDGFRAVVDILVSEVVALDCARPVFCASPLRGSAVAVDPIEVVPAMLVALVVDEAEVESAAEVTVDGAGSDSDAPLEEDIFAVGAVVTADDVSLVGGVLPVDGESVVDELESVVDESESVGSAHATPGPYATATPMPSATANAPTRPIYAP